MEVVNFNSGKMLKPFRERRLIFKSPTATKIYTTDYKTNRPNAIINKNGWLITGNVKYDNYGCFYVIDRLNECIKYKDFQISPVELETVFLKNPKIADACVIGIPDDVTGELPLAFVVKSPGRRITKQEIQEYISDNPTRLSQLLVEVVFISEMPRNTSGKILRGILKQLSNNLRSKL